MEPILEPAEAEPLRPKKRSRNPGMWKQNIIKMQKVRGLEHRAHYRHILKPARQIVQQPCRHNCNGKLSNEEKQWIINKFNGFPCHVSQNIYLQGCTIPLENGRFDYIIQLPDKIEIVCQKTFLNFHGIKRSRLQRKVLQRHVPIADGRGKHGNHKTVDGGMLQTVRTFTENLESRSSHYSRNDNRNKTFLESNSTIKSLYNDLLVENPRLNPDDYADGVKFSKFAHIFNYEHNIGFGKPRSDICDRCEIFHAKITGAVAENEEEIEFALRVEQMEHWMEAEIFFQKMSRNYIAATDDTHLFLCFDFQKILPFPVTNVSKEFFLRQLWLFNFGVRNLRSGETHMFTYCEHFGQKGSSEVVSFLKFYIENFVPGAVRFLHLNCDNSFGQNKNRFLMVYLLSMCPARFESITFEFPLPGHSRMMIDADFSLIEKKKRREDKSSTPPSGSI